MALLVPPMDPLERALCARRCGMQLKAQGGNHLQDDGELRVACRRSRLVETVPAETDFDDSLGRRAVERDSYDETPGFARRGAALAFTISYVRTMFLRPRMLKVVIFKLFRAAWVVTTWLSVRIRCRS